MYLPPPPPFPALHIRISPQSSKPGAHSSLRNNNNNGRSVITYLPSHICPFPSSPVPARCPRRKTACLVTRWPPNSPPTPRAVLRVAGEAAQGELPALEPSLHPCQCCSELAVCRPSSMDAPASQSHFPRPASLNAANCVLWTAPVRGKEHLASSPFHHSLNHPGFDRRLWAAPSSISSSPSRNHHHLYLHHSRQPQTPRGGRHQANDTLERDLGR